MKVLRLRLSRFLREGKDAQSLIEVAVSLPLLMLLLLGAVEFGQVAYAAIEVTNAAKAAAAYGAQNAVTAEDRQGMRLAASSDAANLSGTSNFTTTIDNTKCACVIGGALGTPTVAACGAGCGGYIVQVITVDTSASYNPLIFTPGFNASFTLHGHAVQEVLN